MTGLYRVAEPVEKGPAQSLSVLVPQQWQDFPPCIATDTFAPSCRDREQPEIAAANTPSQKRWLRSVSRVINSASALCTKLRIHVRCAEKFIGIENDRLLSLHYSVEFVTIVDVY